MLSPSVFHSSKKDENHHPWSPFWCQPEYWSICNSFPTALGPLLRGLGFIYNPVWALIKPKIGYKKNMITGEHLLCDGNFYCSIWGMWCRKTVLEPVKTWIWVICQLQTREYCTVGSAYMMTDSTDRLASTVINLVLPDKVFVMACQRDWVLYSVSRCVEVKRIDSGLAFPSSRGWHI